MRINKLIAGAVFCVMTLFGIAPAFAEKAGGTLVMIVQPEPPSLASYLSTSGPIGLMAPKVYDGLLDYDKDLNAVPSLAESWEVSEDGKTCLLYTSPSPRDATLSRMPSSA